MFPHVTSHKGRGFSFFAGIQGAYGESLFLYAPSCCMKLKRVARRGRVEGGGKFSFKMKPGKCCWIGSWGVRDRCEARIKMDGQQMAIVERLRSQDVG